MIHTYNEYHLGDQLIHLNYLRRAWLKDHSLHFTHHCNPQYHFQLQPLVEHTDIVLADLLIPPDAINAWIGYRNFFYQHQQRKHWVAFHLDWFAYLSDRIGIENPIACKEDLLFDYPVLKVLPPMNFDYLIINSPPGSNQLPDYTPQWFDTLVRELTNAGKKVITTYPTGMAECTLEHHITVSGIGALSKGVKHIIAIDTGPLWTTFNVHNVHTVATRTIYGTTFDSIDLAPNVICKASLEQKT
jgi:hypothetical protein